MCWCSSKVQEPKLWISLCPRFNIILFSSLIFCNIVWIKNEFQSTFWKPLHLSIYVCFPTHTDVSFSLFSTLSLRLSVLGHHLYCNLSLSPDASVSSHMFCIDAFPLQWTPDLPELVNCTAVYAGRGTHSLPLSLPEFSSEVFLHSYI